MSTSAESTVKVRDPRLANYLQDYPVTLFSEELYQSIELMERYSIALALQLLSDLKVFPQLREDPATAAELCHSLGFQHHFVSALHWLLQRVAETGCLALEEEHFRFLQLPPIFNLDSLRQKGLELSGTNAPTLALLDFAANLYPAVARGEKNADQVLFSPEGIGLWLSYFSNENLTYAVNNWLGAELATERLRSRESIRILEVGAGAGSASELLLRYLQERGLLSKVEHYLVTEPNAFFRRRAQRDLAQKYAGAKLEWASFDLNRPWSEQLTDAFDLVYGVNVFHVAKNLKEMLEQARASLKPGGWLVLGECLRPQPRQPLYPELIFQILDSFNDVTLDPLFRPTPGFLTSAQWRQALTTAGFREVIVKPRVDLINELYPHFFIGALGAQRDS